jgi:hypothetical protein
MKDRAKICVTALVLAPAIAFADEPTPDAPTSGAPAVPVIPTPPPRAVPPPVERGGPPQRGFQIQGRMSTQIGLTSIISPGVSLGYRRGNWVFGGQFGVIAGKLEDQDANTTDSFSLVTIMPMVHYGLWESTDRKARLDVVGGLGVGSGKLRRENAGTTTTSKADFVPLLLGLGGDYYLHKNFALGVEIGAQLPVLGKVEDGGMEVNVKGSYQSIGGILRFTFVTGE